MRSLIVSFSAVIALLFAAPANADLVLKGENGARLVLQEAEPCKVPELLDGIALDLIAHIHGYLQRDDGTVKRVCWARNGRWALVKDEEGGGGIVDLMLFSPGV